MWVIRRSTVDWDCSKTQTLLGNLKVRTQPRAEFSVSSEVKHSFPQVGCARNKLQSLIVQLNLKFFFWWDAGFRMDGIPALDLRHLGIGVPHSSLNQPRARATCFAKNKERRNSLTRPEISVGQMLITSHQMQNFLTLAPCFAFLKMMKR